MNTLLHPQQTPFTYLVTEKSSGKRYYGSRYKVNCNTADLGTIYFTSCKEVKELVKQKGVNAFTWEVRLLCESPQQARRYEAKVLLRIKAAQSKNWFNKSNGNQNFYCTGHSTKTKQKMSTKRKGYIMPSEVRRKISLAKKGTPRSLAQRVAQSIRMKGKQPNWFKFAPGPGHPNFGSQRSDETKQKMRDNWNGSVSNHTQETKKKMSLAHLGERNHNFGKPMTADTKAKLSASLRKTKARKHYFHTVETKQNLSNRIWMSHEILQHTRKISKDQIDHYLLLGYIIGRKRFKK